MSLACPRLISRRFRVQGFFNQRPLIPVLLTGSGVSGYESSGVIKGDAKQTRNSSTESRLPAPLYPGTLQDLNPKALKPSTAPNF